MSQASDFDLAYVASKDPRLRVVWNGYLGIPGVVMDYPTRAKLCTNLALSGTTIDPQIDMDGADPFGTMTQREQYGYTTVPALLQKLPPVFIPPGIHVPGVPDYDPSQWTIKVSTNIADFPKFIDPEPATSYIGPYAGNGLYNAINNAQNVFSSGQLYTENGITYSFLPAPLIGENFWQFVQKG